MQFSIVILTFNRPDCLKTTLESVTRIPNVEVIIVDNDSETDYSYEEAAKHPNVSVIKLDRNYGAVGRNFGLEKANGKFVVCLDDDVWGITQPDLVAIEKEFNQQPSLSAICFKVLDAKTKDITNWIHPRKKENYFNRVFLTYEISEGAVALRKSTLIEVGYYPIEFFISHEGPDLAFRILENRGQIKYFPDVEVIHAHEVIGRTSWRRYYFDTRNLIWLAYKHYNFKLLILKFPLQLAAMFIYSVRDGFGRYFFGAIFDALRGIRQFDRKPISNVAYRYIKEVDKLRPSLLYYIKKRLFESKIQL